MAELKKRKLTRNPTVDTASLKLVVTQSLKTKADATSFQDGTLLPKLASEHLEIVRGLLGAIGPGQSHGNVPRRVTWGSMCSGSEGAHYVMNAFETAYNSKFPDRPIELVQLFACEVEPGKRKWIHHVVNKERVEEGKDKICIFCDIKDMGNPCARCEVHDGLCPVSDVMILVVSTSCKDLSPLSNNKFSAPVLSLETSPGGSADTFRLGLLAFLDSHAASIVLYENSDQMADDGAQDKATNTDVFQAELASRNFEGMCFILNAKLFGCPQNRRRWVIDSNR